MSTPNFYKIDCEQEAVVQGKSTTFVTITRNDDSQDMPQDNDLIIIIYPEANTFDVHARVIAKYTGFIPASGSVPSKLTFSYSFPESSPIPSFNKLEDGLLIKNWYSIIFPALPIPPAFPLTNGVLSLADAPFVIDDVTSTSFSVKSITGVTLKALNGTPTFTFDIGKYDATDGDHWQINAGLTNGQQRTLNNTSSTTYWKPYVNVPNPFDGTTLSTTSSPDYINNAYNKGTGFYSRVPPLQTQIQYDLNNTKTNGTTIKIDFDGKINGHLKMNILLLSVNQLDAELNLKTFIDGLVEDEQILQPYGLKSRDLSQQLSANVIADYKEIHFFGYTEDYVKPYRDNEPISYAIENPIYDDRASYGLIKTNPKLSGNVKLTVDSTGSLWLNSFNANDELSDSKYKKFSVSSNSTYQRDLYTFFDNGKTPTSIVFGLYEFDNQYLNTKRTYDEQYDNFYNYGIENLNSKFYDENFSFLAPIWLRKDVPDYFVLFRVNEPFNVDSYEGRDNQTKFDDYFSQARIIKTYDMRERSKIGSYLRKLVNDDRYKERPLQVSWESDTATYWNGVAYQNGSLTAKGEFAYDYFHKDVTIKDFEEFITGGFERNGVISTNLINLEFLFDDEEAPMYGINRYFGLYVTENQLAEFEIEPRVLGKILGQSPLPKSGVDGEPYSTRSFVQTNPEGIQIPIHYYHNTAYENNDSIVPTYQGTVLGKFPLQSMVDDPLRFFYIKDRNDIFKRINKLTEVNYGTPGSSEYVRATQLQLFDNQEDLSSYAGINEIVSQFPATLLNSGKAQLRVHLLDQHGTGVFEDNEEFILEVKRYNDGDINNRYVIQVTDTTLQTVTVEYFINEDTDYLQSPFTQPAIGETVIANVNDTTMFSAGEQIYIVSGGYYIVDYVDTLAGNIAITNLGGAKNSVPGTIIPTNRIVSNTVTGEATYTQNLIDTQLSIDNYLTINLTDFSIGYDIGNTWRIECDYPSVQKFLLNGTTKNIDTIYTPQYQQFTWRMIANPTGLQPGDAWDYPVLDPNGSEYLSQFSNKGTPAQVAKALATCINSFEGGVVHAYADGETLYMLSSILYEDGNDIQFTRKLLPTSQFSNLGFYVPGNVDHKTVVTQLTSAPYSSINLKYKVIEEIDTPRTDNFYLRITRNSLNDYTIFGRDEADLSSYATATTTGISFVINQSGNIFTEGGIPISLDMSELLVGQTIEVAYTVSTGNIVKQNFIGGVQRKRNRAKISYINGQKYYSDHKVERTGIVVENSNVILVDTELLYLGAPVSGPGIPEGTVITDVNADRITINKFATATYTDALLKMGDLNILNDTPIWQQWYQAQKGIYSRMKSWEVQGKLIYSLPYMDEPTYDDFENINGFTGINDNSIIQLEDTDQEFFISNDERIVAYKVFRPTLGIFSIYPIKQFDFDFILSDYSYTPTLEALPYFFNEEASIGEYVELPMYENFVIKQVDKLTGGTIQTDYKLDVSVLNKSIGTWQVVETLSITPNLSGEIIFNTFYPFYEYDETEFPIYQYTLPTEKNYSQYVGTGKRNFDKRYIRILNEVTGKTEIIYPDSFRITLKSAVYSDSKINVNNVNYLEDRDIKLFSGFAGIQDIEGIQDLSVIQTLKDEGKYVESLTYQLLISEYDRLRENFNKDYAVKSKVVPYINKWVQEGTDARDNYYRLNNSMAFGINNLSPNDQVDFSETAVLTQEFPYLDTFPKNYPNESAEFSRSYMFSQLDDLAYQGRTWYELLTTDSRNDWFTKYFSVGYPTEILRDGTIIPKSREERYTFFNYNEGLNKSQTLFRGIKLQGIIYDDTDPQNITEISESTLLNEYKFASIMRMVKAENNAKEKPVDIEFIRNDDFKSLLMVITVKVEDYRLQHGHTDYMSQYFMNDLLKTTNQYQTDVNMNNASLRFRDFYPYSSWDPTSYQDVSILRLRQGFLGGGLLQLGDKRLGGILDSGQVTYNPPFLNMRFNSVDPTYVFNLQNELSTIINNYAKGPLEIYSNTSFPNIPHAKMYGKDGFVFGIHTVYKLSPGQGTEGMYSVLNNQTGSDLILPANLQLNTGAEMIKYYAGIPNSNYRYPGFQSGMEGSRISVNGAVGFGNEIMSTALEGGTFGYESIKNYLTLGNIKTLINTNSAAIEYYKVVKSNKVPATDYRIEVISPDTIIKTDILHFTSDDDKPQEYTNVDLIGYNLVNTNMQEYLIRHRGYYEPKSRDIITFWLRESNDFTRHFEKDFILSNTHINGSSSLSGIIQNYGINKVATTGEILNIARGSAYKSLYPLIGEVSVDTWTRFSLDSSWDDNFYRNYQTITKSTEVEGISEMKETKSFLASKAMNVPKSFEIHTFNANEVSFDIQAPATGIGVSNLITNTTVNDQYIPGADKPKLIISIDVKARLLRQIIEDINSGLYIDEFSKLQTYTNVNKLGDSLSNATVSSLKELYITKNILQLYEVTEIYLYVLYEEGINLVSIILTEAEKNVAGYKIDKDCVVRKVTNFTYKIEKTLDPKVAAGYSLSTTVKRI